MHTATVLWERGEQPFLDRRYSRRHLIRFDGGAEVPGSSSPTVVKPPLSDPAAVDPEELFIASLASCHMLWFLDIVARRGFRAAERGLRGVGNVGGRTEPVRGARSEIVPLCTGTVTVALPTGTEIVRLWSLRLTLLRSGLHLASQKPWPRNEAPQPDVYHPG